MFLLLRGLPVLLEIGLTIYCLIEAITAPEHEVRNLPKWGWIILILMVPLVGSIAWLFAGRPAGPRNNDYYTSGFPEHLRHQWAPAAPKGPDDDPEYLRQLGKLNSEHEQTLKQWEDDLRRREEELRRKGSADD